MRRAFLLLFVLACSRTNPTLVRDASVTMTSAIDDMGDPGLPPLGGDWLQPVSVGEKEIAKVSIPIGSTSRRPWMIAFHGAGDRAEWACGAWSGVTSAHPFIVCPRGDRSGYYYGTPKETTRDITNAIAALRAQHPDRIESGDAPIVAGFSMGATEALLVVRYTDLKTPPVLVLVEGGYETIEKDPLLFSVLKQKGVDKMLFACTTGGGCPTRYAAARTRAEKAGIDARFLQAARKDHGMYPEVTEALARQWPWITESLAGFGA